MKNSETEKRDTRGVEIKYHCPLDFLHVVEKLKKTEKLSVNALRQYYNIPTPTVINRWLKESGIVIEKSNKKKEESIDLKQFTIDCQSGEFRIESIAKKYGISKSNVKDIIKRNKIVETDFIERVFNPTLDEFLVVAKNSASKIEIAKHYDTTLAVIINYTKRHSIVDQVKDLIETFDSNLLKEALEKDSTHTIGSLARKFGLNRSVVIRHLEKTKSEIPKNQFDQWKESYSSLSEELDTFIDLNKNHGKSLLDIANDRNISIEHLKKLFRETNTPIVLHSCNKSKGELEVKKLINSLGVECISTKRKHNDKRFEIDCYAPQYKIGIEYCGEWWHSENNGTPKKYHQEKMLWCREQGIDLLTIFEHEWLYKKPIIESIIRHKFGKTENRVFARNTVFSVIESHDARQFHETNHLNGYFNSSLNYGLLDKKTGEILSVFSLAKPRFDKNYDYELTRFSTKLNTSVVGGLSKFLSNLPKDVSLMTYVDLRFGTGSSYLNCGFKTIYDYTVPNYFYFDKKNPQYGFQSRMKFQKKNLLKENEEWSNLTEKEIMMNEKGFYRIYDCGNAKLEFKTK